MAVLNATSGARARRFDADGEDEVLEPTIEAVESIGERQLLWIDIDRAAAADVLKTLGPSLGLRPDDPDRISQERGRAWLSRSDGHLHLTIMASSDTSDENERTSEDHFTELDLIVGRNLVATIHDGPLPSIDDYVARLEGDSNIGALSAADLMSSIVDEVIGGYFTTIERIERAIDDLDTTALRGERDDHILSAIVAVRRRIAKLRRIVAPHRDTLVALARPELRAETEIGEPWPGLVDRLERAVDSVEALRDALLGTFDIAMARATQRTDGVITTLTLLSAVLLPASLLAGIMGMNFELEVYQDPGGFILVLAAMAGIAITILVAARLRHWI